MTRIVLSCDGIKIIMLIYNNLFAPPYLLLVVLKIGKKRQVIEPSRANREENPQENPQ